MDTFLHYWPFVRGIHRSPVYSPQKSQWRGALMFSLINAWTNCWANNSDAGDLRRHRANYDVTAMTPVPQSQYYFTGTGTITAAFLKNMVNKSNESRNELQQCHVSVLISQITATPIQQLVQANNKENIKSPYHRPFVRGSGFPSLRTSTRESASMSWRHREYNPNKGAKPFILMGICCKCAPSGAKPPYLRFAKFNSQRGSRKFLFGCSGANRQWIFGWRHYKVGPGDWPLSTMECLYGKHFSVCWYRKFYSEQRLFHMLIALT